MPPCGPRSRSLLPDAGTPRPPTLCPALQMWGVCKAATCISDKTTGASAPHGPVGRTVSQLVLLLVVPAATMLGIVCACYRWMRAPPAVASAESTFDVPSAPVAAPSILLFRSQCSPRMSRAAGAPAGGSFSWQRPVGRAVPLWFLCCRPASCHRRRTAGVCAYLCCT